MKRLLRLLREPLFHFIAIGGLIFTLYAAVEDPSEALADVIVITPARIDQLATGFSSVWKRKPTDDELDALAFVKLLREKIKSLGIAEDMMKRPVNVGFSGGEKKRNEVLQMAALEPALAVLDETDSGLDIDALKIVSEGINNLRAPDRSMLLITHYQRLLDYVVPDKVHVLAHGRIQRSGGKELALELEENGYAEFDEAAA